MALLHEPKKLLISIPILVALLCVAAMRWACASYAQTDLAESCVYNHVRRAKELLSDDINPNYVVSLEDACNCGDNPSPATPLTFASLNGNRDIIDLLIRHGAAVNYRNADGSTALDWAVSAKVAALLICEGASITSRDKRGLTPLMYACIANDEAQVGLLLSRHADVDAIDNDGETALMFAGSAAVACEILRKGADPNARGKNGETVLEHAIDTNHNDLVKLIVIKGASLTERDGKGRIAEDYALDKTTPDVIEMLKPNAHQGQR